MPTLESEAIILKTFPLGEADRLVSFLSRGQGRLRGVAAGARRLKNRFGSALEVLAYVRVEFFEKETRDLVRIRECELLESFHKAQSDYALATGLAVISEIAETVLPEREPAEAMFRLVLLSAREIQRRGSWEVPLGYFALWSLKLGGWLPPLEECGRCGAGLAGKPAYISSTSPLLLCEKCRSGKRTLSAQARDLGASYLAERLDRIEAGADAGGAAKELREAALDWVELQSERKLQTRELLETI
ncbi:MAG TPA: DNA repair protein RecO [Methylomirabilota bacterium]|nr:DNA repair protein RecO [Methylomirabilota bacterium]